MTADAVTTIGELTNCIANIPRVRLATLPTPLDCCPRLSARLGGPPIWIKRDDLTGLATGGNKTRYLEFVLADAKAKGAETLVISSGNQSNHCRQVAAAAARLGMQSVLLLWGSKPRELDGNLLLDAVLGAEVGFLSLSPRAITATGSMLPIEPEFATESPPLDRSRLHEAMAETMVRLRRQGRKPYCINTDAPLGLPAIGYVECAIELIHQMRDAGIETAHVFAASGGGTQAGLLAGSLLLGSPFTITGICYHASSTSGRQERIAAMATQAAQMLGFDLTVRPDQVDSDASYATQPLYDGMERRWEPVLEVARTEGILLEPTYVGRAMLAICERIRARRIPDDCPVILLHSGGIPLLFPLGRHALSPKAYLEA